MSSFTNVPWERGVSTGVMREVTSMTLVRPSRRNVTTVGGSDDVWWPKRSSPSSSGRGDEVEAIICIEPLHFVVGGGS